MDVRSSSMMSFTIPLVSCCTFRVHCTDTCDSCSRSCLWSVQIIIGIHAMNPASRFSPIYFPARIILPLHSHLGFEEERHRHSTRMSALVQMTLQLPVNVIQIGSWVIHALRPRERQIQVVSPSPLWTSVFSRASFSVCGCWFLLSVMTVKWQYL